MQYITHKLKTMATLTFSKQIYMWLNATTAVDTPGASCSDNTNAHTSVGKLASYVYVKEVAMYAGRRTNLGGNYIAKANGMCPTRSYVTYNWQASLRHGRDVAHISVSVSLLPLFAA